MAAGGRCLSAASVSSCCMWRGGGAKWPRNGAYNHTTIAIASASAWAESSLDFVAQQVPLSGGGLLEAIAVCPIDFF
jgi:hypothetical protein